MTNLYVGGYSITPYASINNSNTLINADKLEKSYIRVVGSLYMDEERNLYGDIQGTNLIESNVEDFNMGVYLKNNTIYRASDKMAIIEQVKELLFSYDYGDYIEVIYNDVNDITTQTHVPIGAVSTSKNQYNTKLVECFVKYGSTALVAITEDGYLVVNDNYRISSTITKITNYDKCKKLIPCVDGTKYGYAITENNKLYGIYYGGSYGTYYITENPLKLTEDEYIVSGYPYNKFVKPYSGGYVYLFKTTNRVITNSTYLNGLDPDLFLDIFVELNGRNTCYFAATTIIEYPLTIYNRDNETIAASVRVLPFNAATITVDGTTATLTLNSVINTSYNVVFQIEKIKGYGFQGLTQVIDSKIPEIVVGNNIGMWGGVLNFYQVYNKVLPNDAVDITLYNMRCEENRVNKASWLDKVEDMRGVFRTTVSVEDPIIYIEYDQFPTFNYVYIRNFNRYYFVKHRDAVSKNIYAITLHIDVLYSFMNEIGNNTAILSRSSTAALQNPELTDSRLPLNNNEEVEVIYTDELTPATFNVDNSEWNNVYRYVLTCFSSKDPEPVSVEH